MANIKGYLGGDIMTFGSNLARQYEYEQFLKLNLPVDVYSPVKNKSINDKANMTEEENNHLAEKITEADIDRLWESDFVVMSPEQSAIGSMCETGTLYGWKYMADKLLNQIAEELDEKVDSESILIHIIQELYRIVDQKNYFHYYDIRTNHLNEKDWRRSFGVNQLLYGMVLYASRHPDGFQSFESILAELQMTYGRTYGRKESNIDNEI